MRTVALAFALVLGVAQPAASAPLEPTDRWVVDFGDSHCIAQQSYGQKKEPVFLILKAPALGDGLQLSIVEDGSKSGAYQEKARVTFGLNDTLDISQLRYGIEKKRVRTLNLTREQVDQLSASTRLRWSTPHANYDFHLNNMRDLVKVIEECRSTLSEDWNGTEEKKTLLKQEAHLDKPVGQLFSTSDYPQEAVMATQSGTAKVMGLIDELGKLKDCMIVETSGVAVLDAQTCIMIALRGKFSPAIGPDAKPTKSIFVQRIRWEMPK